MTIPVTLTVIIMCSLANMDVSPRCTAPVDYFVVNEDGTAWGMLTSGVTFTQGNITNELGKKFQRFQLEDAFWYITDKGIIYADNDLQALSKYLAI